MGVIKKKIKLKPCPFCGGEIEKRNGVIYGTKTFICRKCGADVMFYGGEKDPKATEKWNNRVCKKTEYSIETESGTVSF